MQCFRGIHIWTTGNPPKSASFGNENEIETAEFIGKTSNPISWIGKLLFGLPLGVLWPLEDQTAAISYPWDTSFQVFITAPLF
jgi:hypothetical protein